MIIKILDDDGNATDAGNNQSMFFLTILEKVKETRLKFSQGNEIKILSRKYDTTVKDGKLSRSKS